MHLLENRLVGPGAHTPKPELIRMSASRLNFVPQTSSPSFVGFSWPLAELVLLGGLDVCPRGHKDKVKWSAARRHRTNFNHMAI